MELSSLTLRRVEKRMKGRKANVFLPERKARI
jgi:hypothetical protein